MYSEFKYHTFAVDFPSDVVAYLDKEIRHGAIIGPFHNLSIPRCHFDPFMVCHKPNSVNRREIVDLSWPNDNSVNDSADKNVYFGTRFALAFPSRDDITDEVLHLGKGAHVYEIDIPRAF